MDTQTTESQLEKVIALLKLAHREEIGRARDDIRSNKIRAAVLDGTKKWTPAGKLKASVVKKTGAGSSTVNERIAELLLMGVLDKRGGGPTTEYRATGLI